MHDAELSKLLKKWVESYAPPMKARARLLRLARHITPPVHSSPLRALLYEPFIPLDWSRFAYNRENTLIFQLDFPWNRHIA
jgi:hypothetical protein